MASSEDLERLLEETLGSERHAEALVSGDAWRRLCAALARAEQRVLGDGVPGDRRHRAEGYRYLARLLAAGLRSCVTHDDPDYPVLHRMIDYSTPWGLDHPDCLYVYGALRGGANYRLFGNRGTANVLDIQVNGGHFSAGRVEAVETLATLDGAALAVDADGRFQLDIGPDAPESGGLKVGPEARFLHIRQYFSDWENERPADLLLEREGAPYPIPAPRPALIGRQLETLEHWIERGGALWEALSRRFLSMPENSVIVHPVSGANTHGALSGQYYAMGHFHCPPGAAVVVSFRTPSCAHWNVSLSNVFWECVEYASRQSSLNPTQARPDPGGGFTCVIAHTDPGHPNWLDPGGNERGTLALRLHQAASAPEIGLERVPADGLAGGAAGRLPPIDPGRRQAILQRRRRAVLRRLRV